MASLRHKRRRSCTSKQQHDTMWEAQQVARRMERRHDMPFDVYRCSHCGHFHLRRNKWLSNPHGSKYIGEYAR